MKKKDRKIKREKKIERGEETRVTRRKFSIAQEVHLTISRIAMKEREEKLKRHRDIGRRSRGEKRHGSRGGRMGERGNSVDVNKGNRVSFR